jgi:hypothetical protein
MTVLRSALTSEIATGMAGGARDMAAVEGRRNG